MLDVARRMTVRLTAEQWNTVSAASRALGVPAAEVVRGAVETLSDRLPTGWAERSQTDPEQVAALHALRMEVRRIGVNVNQASRALNAAGAELDAATIIEQLRMVYVALEELEGVVGDVRRDGG